MVLMLTGFTAVTFAAGHGRVAQKQQLLRQQIVQARYTGALSRRQARFLNAERKSIGREIHADRAAHAGRLNRAEKYAINQQQKQLSRQVYFAKR